MQQRRYKRKRKEVKVLLANKSTKRKETSKKRNENEDKKIASERLKQKEISIVEAKGMSQTNGHSNIRLFEIDNRNLPTGIPPIRPVLPSWQHSAPQLGEMHELEAWQSAKKEEKSNEQEVQIKSVEAIQQEILALLQENGHAMDADTLYEALQVTEGSVREALQGMLSRNDVFLSRKHKIALPSQLGYLTGKLQTTGRGFGFLLPDDGSADVYISQPTRNNAMNGDRVVIRTMPSDARGHSREGIIIGIQERANAHIVGILEKDENGYYVQPDNPRLDAQYRIKRGGLNRAKRGQKVVANIDYEKTPMQVMVSEVLGFPDEVGVDVLAVIKDHGIPTEFSDELKTSLTTIPDSIHNDDILLREDCRKMTCVTIDGADSKDFDDAVSCERLSNGHYLLGVHIADVAHYVQEGTALDREAYERGTSVYFIGRVVPMLPEELSNGICSLNPRVDRLALSCFMEIDQQGEMVSHRMAETVIRSKSRLVYQDVTALLDGRKTQRKRYKSLTPMLDMMHELSDLLARKREERGSLDFDIPEAKIVVDENGKPKKIEVQDRGSANRLIESFMLACNETIAQHVSQLGLPMAYRVHENPDQERMEELRLLLAPYGITLRTDIPVKPKALQAIMKQIVGTPAEASVSRMLLRSLKKARYLDENRGHFGLAADYYTHFTSPIRRYPDLLVHRLLKELMRGKLTQARIEQWRDMLPEMMVHCSERERTAMEAERDVDDLKKCEYMSNFIGQEFNGHISGVTNFGLFVELPNTCEGLIRMNELQDDYYVFDDKQFQIVGQNTKRVFRLGDSIRIRVEQADINSRRVDFSRVMDEKDKARVQKRAKAMAASKEKKDAQKANAMEKPKAERTDKAKAPSKEVGQIAPKAKGAEKTKSKAKEIKQTRPTAEKAAKVKSKAKGAEQIKRKAKETQKAKPKAKEEASKFSARKNTQRASNTPKAMKLPDDAPNKGNATNGIALAVKMKSGAGIRKMAQASASMAQRANPAKVAQAKRKPRKKRKES